MNWLKMIFSTLGNMIVTALQGDRSRPTTPTPPGFANIDETEDKRLRELEEKSDPAELNAGRPDAEKR